MQALLPIQPTDQVISVSRSGRVAAVKVQNDWRAHIRRNEIFYRTPFGIVGVVITPENQTALGFENVCA